MKNPNQSKEAFEQSPLIDRRTAITGLLSVGVLIMAGLKSCSSCSGSEQATEANEIPGSGYLGTWKYAKNQDYMKFSPSKNIPPQTLELNGHQAKLLIPAHMRFYIKRKKFGATVQLEMNSINGGIYRVDGKQDAFIAKMSLVDYLIVGLKKVDQKHIKATGKETGEYRPNQWKWHRLNRMGKFKGIKSNK